MSKLFEFFKTKNLERKFSRLGDGHRLGDPPESRSVPQQMPADPPKQVNQSSKSTNKAADAALERLNQQRGKPKDSSKYAVRHEVEQALRVQREAEELRERFTQKVVTVEKPTVIARVLFCCPALFASSVIGSRDHVDQAIHNYLIAEGESNFAEAATLILARGLENSKPPTSPDIPLAEQQTASEWREKRQQHFLRILTNLLQSPENPTFRRLRMGNNLVADLLSIDGAEMFFRACGFTKQMLPVQKPAGTNDDQPGDPPSTEPFLVISEEAAQDAQHLQHMFDLLNTAEPILPELFRDTQVFKTSGNLSGLATRDQLPDEFFYQTKEEVKRSLEQQQRIIEESGMLMTKAMRERLRVQEVRLFRYAVVRVRMPDGLILQGTFYANDPLSKVRAWITDCFAIPSVEYQLWAPPGTVAASRSNLPPTARAELTNDVLTLTEYGLAPCSLITLSISQASSTDQPVNLLRPDLLANATSL